MNFGYLKLYIDGQLVDAEHKQKQDIICPTTEEKIAEVAWAGAKDAQLALISP